MRILGGVEHTVIRKDKRREMERVKEEELRNEGNNRAKEGNQ